MSCMYTSNMVSPKKYTIEEISLLRQSSPVAKLPSNLVVEKLCFSDQNTTNLYSSILDEGTQQRISDLEKSIQQFAFNNENGEKPARKNTERSVISHDRRVNNKFSSERKRSQDDSENWNAGKSFKITPKLVKTDTDKTITDVRMALNKMTTKNYESQSTVIVELIQQIMDVSSDEIVDTENQIKKIAKIIFDIASSNKILSEIYAELYKKLIGEFGQFQANMEDLLENYHLSLHEIHYADPNNDYDGYCKYTKTNDIRKAMTMFIVNLMRKGILTENSILETIIYLEKAILKYAEETEKNNEVEEITENLFILISQSVSVLKDREDWIDQIIPAIHHLSKLKKTEGAAYPSMSNRATYKYMDILDALN